MASEAERNRAVLELQLIEQIVSELQVRMVALDNSIVEHQNASNLLEALEKSGETNVLVPIGGGSYIHGEVPQLDVVKVGVGAGVVVEKKPVEATRILESRREALQKAREDYRKRILGYLSRADQLRSIIESQP